MQNCSTLYYCTVARVDSADQNLGNSILIPAPPLFARMHAANMWRSSARTSPTFSFAPLISKCWDRNRSHTNWNDVMQSICQGPQYEQMSPLAKMETKLPRSRFLSCVLVLLLVLSHGRCMHDNSFCTSTDFYLREGKKRLLYIILFSTVLPCFLQKACVVAEHHMSLLLVTLVQTLQILQIY